MATPETPSSSAPTLQVNATPGFSSTSDVGEKAVVENARSSVSSLSEDGVNEVREQEAGRQDLEKLETKHTEVSMHHPSQFPDGGFKAWSAVLGGFACLFCSFGWINCIGIFQGYYQANQLSAYTPSQISWISSLETFCMFFFGPIIGKYYDAYGSRYILILGTFLHVFGLMMTSISTKYYHFLLAQGVVSATGASFIFYPALGDVSTWFFKRRAFALGMMASGSSLGGVIMPIMIERLILKVGYGWAMRTTAFLILGMMIIANLTLRSRLPPKGWSAWKLSEFTKHFREPGFVLTVLAACLFFFGMFLPFNYIVVAAKRNGMSNTLATYLVAVLNAASTFGRILPGLLGDRVGRYNTMISISYLSGILVLALWLPTTGNAPAIVFAALYGFTTGAFVSLAPACLAQISEIREIGVRNGALFACVSVAALTGVPIGGALVTRYDGGFTGLQIFAGCMLVAGSTVFVMARVVVGGWKMMKVV